MFAMSQCSSANLFPSNILHACILHIAIFAYKRQKQTLQADFFCSVLFWIISKRFIAIFFRERCIRLPVPASFFTLWRYGGEQPLRQRWRKTLGCHRDADDSAPSVKGKTDCGGLNNIVSAAKKKRKEKKKNLPPGRHKHHQRGTRQGAAECGCEPKQTELWNQNSGKNFLGIRGRDWKKMKGRRADLYQRSDFSLLPRRQKMWLIIQWVDFFILFYILKTIFCGDSWRAATSRRLFWWCLRKSCW